MPEECLSLKTDGIWIVNAAGRTLYANKRMAEILKTSRPEMVGHLSLLYVVPEGIHPCKRDMVADKEEVPNTLVRLRLLRADSSAVWLEVKQSAIRGASGKVVGVMGVFRVVEQQPKGGAFETIGQGV
jgi:PAS domain S-box-containing protein